MKYDIPKHTEEAHQLAQQEAQAFTRVRELEELLTNIVRLVQETRHFIVERGEEVRQVEEEQAQTFGPTIRAGQTISDDAEINERMQRLAHKKARAASWREDASRVLTELTAEEVSIRKLEEQATARLHLLAEQQAEATKRVEQARQLEEQQRRPAKRAEQARQLAKRRTRPAKRAKQARQLAKRRTRAAKCAERERRRDSHNLQRYMRNRNRDILLTLKTTSKRMRAWMQAASVESPRYV